MPAITKSIAVEAVSKTWEMVQRDLDSEAHVEAADELADHFKTIADAAREEME